MTTPASPRGEGSVLTPRIERDVSALLALAERCQREEPSRGLDTAIAEMIGWQNVRRHYGTPVGERPTPIDGWDIVPFFSTSIDAAAKLVPDGWRFAHMERYLARTGDWGVALKSNDPAVGGSSEGAYATAVAKTEPMARCAAALRALARMARAATPVGEATTTQQGGDQT